ncbi:MAG: ABC transporter permease [Planctomycetota bacterium]
MILRVLRVGLLRLRHNPVEVLLALVVPVVFFTIFALIFDKQLGAGKTKPIRVATVDCDGSELSQQLLDSVAADDLVLHNKLADRHGADDPGPTYQQAGDLVLRGDVTISIAVQEGWTDSLETDNPLPLLVIADTSDPVAPRMIESVLQRAFGESRAEAQATALKESAAKIESIKANALAGGPAASDPTASPSDLPGLPPPAVPSAETSSQTQPTPAALAPLEVQKVDLFGDGKANPVVSMYAAGIAVMFLLFSATGNAGSLLDEEENQTLERLMCSRLGMTQLLLGKWLTLGVVGVIQVAVMFAWAQLVFGVNVLAKLPGFTLMTLATVAAASSLALVLAAACKSRGQLNAVSVILILTMSALGGSMVPRYLMSESMQQMGRLTFNAWAIDGYNKLFWRDLPLAELGPELAVLGGSAVALLLVARLLARRWEMA